MNLSQEAVKILLFLAPGFVALRLMMIDGDWKGLSQLDIFYGSLTFSALGYAVSQVLGILASNIPPVWLTISTFCAAILLALVWRKWGHAILHEVLQWFGLTNEDNRGNVWQKIFNDPRLYVTQITAYMKDGEVIGCDGTAEYDNAFLRSQGVFPYYSHRDGQLCFVPTFRKRKGAAKWTKVGSINVDHPWGLRMVYLNPTEVQRLELRVVPVAQPPDDTDTQAITFRQMFEGMSA